MLISVIPAHVGIQEFQANTKTLETGLRDCVAIKKDGISTLRLRSGQAPGEIVFQKEGFLAPTAPGLEMTEWLQEYVKCYKII